MEKNVIEQLDELLSSSEKWVIVDSEGKTHELSEGVTGTAKKIDPKEEVYKLLGVNPKYITFENLRNLDNIFKNVIELLYYDASYSVQKKYQEFLKTGEIVTKERKKRETKVKEENK